MKLFLNSPALHVLSGLFTDLSAGWIGSIVITPIFSDADPFLLLTTNIVPAIVSLEVAIFLAKKAKVYE